MDVNKRKSARRLRRKRHIRKTMIGTAARPRLTVTRSLRNIHCQIIDDARGVTLASASSLAQDLRSELGSGAGTRVGAERVGTLIAQRAKELGLSQLRFDRNGYKYHGRIAALADAVRKEGIEV